MSGGRVPVGDAAGRVRRRPWLALAGAVAGAVLLASCNSREVAEEPIVWDSASCALDRAIVNASHVVRVDASSGAITAVELTRTDDPRAAAFAANPITPGSAVTLTRHDQVDGFADGGSDVVALVGQPRTDLPDEWTVYAAASTGGGALQFVGPCGDEFDRQFVAVQEGFDGSPDAAFLERMVDEALQPGRGADLVNMVAPSAAREVTDLLPPRWEGRVRVVSMTAVLFPGGSGGVVALRSAVGSYGVGVATGVSDSATTVWTLAVVPTDAPVTVTILEVDVVPEHVLATPLDLADSECRDAVGIHLRVDLVELTAACTAEIDAGLQAQVDAAQAALQFDHSAAVPDYTTGPPTHE